MTFTALLIVLVVGVQIAKMGDDNLHQVIYPTLVGLRRHKSMHKNVGLKRRRQKDFKTNNKSLLVLLMLLLLCGDVEQNPGPVSVEQYREMNRGQRGRVTKPDMELLLTQLVDNNEDCLLYTSPRPRDS